MAPFEALKPVVELFAIATMHNCRVEIEPNVTVTLRAGVQGGGEIIVAALIPTIEDPLIKLGTAMFVAALAPAEHCEPILLSTTNALWLADLELTPQHKLGLLS
jgi:hypothetical protein